MSADEAAAHVMNNDISHLLDQAEVVRERRPAKMVTALRIDLDNQSALEAAATARGIDVTTLMQQIIEDWVDANRDVPADHISELVRHLDAARRTANSLANGDATSGRNHTPDQPRHEAQRTRHGDPSDRTSSGSPQSLE